VSLHRLVWTAALAGSLAAGPPAHGAEVGRLAIDGVDVEQVSGLAAGVALRFSVYGTPHASAVLRLEGGWRVLALRESEPGIYEGTYVIDAHDAIRPGSRVTATLQQGGQIANADLDEPLLLADVPLPWAEAASAVARPAPALPSPPSPTLQPAPLPVAAAPTSATGWVAPPRRAVAPPPATATAPPAAAAPVVVARAPDRASCDDCAFVQSVRLVEPPPGGPIGRIASKVANAVLGDELGQVHTEHMRRLFDALGGRSTARDGQTSASQRAQYDVVLRTRDGGSQVRRYDHAPQFGPGDTVRLGVVRGESAPAPL
jgi:hypothetical protein